MQPPEEHLKLNKDSFVSEVQLKALRVPSRQLQKYMKLLRG